MTTAAIYTRYSSDAQREASSEDQARNCRRRIEAEGWELGKHYKDEGISGSTSERPGYQSMLTAAEQREFDVLLLDDLSRLSRDQVESERVIRRLEFAGVRILSVSDGYDSESKSRKLQRGFKGLMNEMFLDDLRDKVHRGLEGQALKKYSAGGKSYGYRPVKITDSTRTDTYGEASVIGFRREVIAEQAEIVREIFQRYAGGEGLRAIASDLNTRGIPSPGASWHRKTRRADGRWLSSTIQSMLRNEAYVGRYIWNKTRWERDPETRRRRSKVRPESEWIVSEIAELAIVPQPIWDHVQHRIAARAEAFPVAMSRSHTGRGGKPKYLLSGLLECAICGQKFVISGNRPPRYVCGSHVNGGPAACMNKARVSRDFAEDKLLAPIVEGLLSPAAVTLAEQEIKRLHREQQTANQDKPGRNAAKIAKLDAQLAQLEKLQADGVLSPDVAGAAIAKAKADREPLVTADDTGDTMKLNRIVKMLPRAADAYRAQVEKIREVLQDEKAVHRARVALRDLLDGPVKLRPSPEGRYLVAEISYSSKSLLRAAGSDLWNGSGGRI